MKGNELPKISDRARQINRELEEAGSPEISVYPDVFTRKPTPFEIEKEEKAERRVKHGN